MVRYLALLAVVVGLMTIPACASVPYPQPQVQVLVDGRTVPVYYGQGKSYIEALKGKEYSIRLRNPLGVRVAVALSVDGLNTIDARHTDARSAQKWVLGPYETVTISGWQTNMQHARRFFFTSEEQSYGAWLGKTQDLGIITAVYFREKQAPPPPPRPMITPAPSARDSSKGQRQEAPSASAAPHAEAGQAAGSKRDKLEQQPQQRAQEDEYAATGIGNRVDHQVYRVQMQLEERPFATVNLRYEYRPQLVRLGLLPPSNPPYPDPLARRQNARGFEPGFCPEPR